MQQSMVNLNKTLTGQFQARLDAISTVFQVALFTVQPNLCCTDTLSIHQQMLLESEILTFNADFKLMLPPPQALDRSAIHFDALDQQDIYTQHWFISLKNAVLDPPYGTQLAKSQYAEFFQMFCDFSYLSQPDCEILDWVGCYGSGRNDCSNWHDYFIDGREWWGN